MIEKNKARKRFVLQASRGSLALLAFLLAACSTTQSIYEPAQTTLTRPALHTVSTARPGSEMYRETPFLLYESIYVSDSIILGPNKEYRVQPGYYNKSSGPGSRYERFAPGNGRQEGKIEGTGKTGKLAWLELRDNDGLCVVAQGEKPLCNAVPGIQRMTRRLPVKDAIQRSLVFRGRAENDILLLYRETALEINMAVQEVEFRYNARQARIVSPKGLRLEILELSPALVKYRVLSGFTSPCISC